MYSLRIRLLLLLGVVIALATIAQFAATFRTSMDRADTLFDFHMRQMALALQDSNFDQPEWTLPNNEQSPFLEFIIQVWTAEGKRVYQTPSYRNLPPPGPTGYGVIQSSMGKWRTYKVESNGRVVQIAQLLDRRRSRAMTIAFESVWPLLPVAFLLFGAAWWVVTSALRPVNRIGAELADRNAMSLTPVSHLGVPREVMPLVAELNSLLGRLAKAIDSQQHFIADAAHELRSPLTALTLQIQTLSRARSPEAKEQATRRLAEGVERSRRLIEQLLALARQERVPERADGTRASLADVVRKAIADTILLGGSRGIVLECRQLDDVVVPASPDDLHILVRNLLDNAMRYTPEGGQVDVTLAHAESKDDLAGGALLTIDDSGPGIPQESRERVFDRFYRLPGNEASGSGLGLAIVRAIASRHGAEIRLEQSPLGGLRVAVRFASAVPAPDLPGGLVREPARTNPL
ncbi:ATP-binding protein [Noviherbaspirillum galbum]|uniref:histidine kinase n=1 Tax=Noviherbaspirillum galbum TaxID=2709383 RepID=A0A6B3SUL2_9BURK|nr:ATP-binding protein [Noviherbaspirillum galbum]NEX64710.1 two-component sensor histidine kinase [Noviherbaspirillum galbum]